MFLLWLCFSRIWCLCSGELCFELNKTSRGGASRERLGQGSRGREGHGRLGPRASEREGGHGSCTDSLKSWHPRTYVELGALDHRFHPLPSLNTYMQAAVSRQPSDQTPAQTIMPIWSYSAKRQCSQAYHNPLHKMMMSFTHDTPDESDAPALGTDQEASSSLRPMTRAPCKCNQPLVPTSLQHTPGTHTPHSHTAQSQARQTPILCRARKTSISGPGKLTHATPGKRFQTVQMSGWECSQLSWSR
jgi:hypothetical protein